MEGTVHVSSRGPVGVSLLWTRPDSTSSSHRTWPLRRSLSVTSTRVRTRPVGTHPGLTPPHRSLGRGDTSSDPPSSAVFPPAPNRVAGERPDSPRIDTEPGWTRRPLPGQDSKTTRSPVMKVAGLSKDPGALGPDGRPGPLPTVRYPSLFSSSPYPPTPLRVGHRVSLPVVTTGQWSTDPPAEGDVLPGVPPPTSKYSL